MCNWRKYFAECIGTAVLVIFGCGTPIAVLWIFVIGPFVGAALAALVHKCFTAKKA